MNIITMHSTSACNITK